ncbi:interferon-induced protein 44-like [Crassostrea virginica]
MSELLEKTYRDQLVSWIGRPCHFRLLYKISRDGCSAPTFHQKCDGQGPTVTVLYNTNNTIFGGYLSKSWNSNAAKIYDTSAFLFRLQYNGLYNPVQFPSKCSVGAGYGDNNYGPTFGGGHDIYTFSGTINKSGNYFALNGNFNNMDNTYNLNGQSFSSITNNNLQVTDLEVFKVEDRPKPVKKNVTDSVLLEKPWRKFPEFSTETMLKLKEDLVHYAPDSNSDVPSTNILLIGQIGAGKSSFFNSVNSIFSGKMTSKARSGSFEHSLTTVFRKYSIKDHNSGQTLKLRLCDTRGLEEDSSVDPQDVVYILDGHVPDRYQVHTLYGLVVAGSKV